jgi:serine protease Do
MTSPAIPGLHRALDVVSDALLGSTVRVRGPAGSSGSGVAWRDGLVVTSAHVVRHPRLIVELRDGRTHRARLVALDDRRDVAVLEVPGLALPLLEAGDETSVRPGDVVLAVGYPFGHREAVTLGVVHSVPAADDGGVRRVLADVRLHPGNSGGALADARGRVLGINAMIVGGLAVAVAGREVERVVHAVAGPVGRAA